MTVMADNTAVTLNPLQAPRLEEIRAGRKFWGYLDTDALRTRYVLAAHFVRACRHLIEIGGYRENVITRFLHTRHDSVTVFSLDQEFEPHESSELNGLPCQVRHIRGYFQAHPKIASAAGDDLGLVVLGLELQGDQEPFLELLRCARVAVLEVALDHPPGMAALNATLAATRAKTTCVFDLDLSGNEPLLREQLASNMNRPFWRRRLHVLERA